MEVSRHIIQCRVKHFQISEKMVLISKTIQKPFCINHKSKLVKRKLYDDQLHVEYSSILYIIFKIAMLSNLCDLNVLIARKQILCQA